MPANVVHVDLSEVSKSLAVLGGFIVIYGLLSYVVKERLYLSEPLLAVTAGIIVGPYVLNWVDPLSWGDQEETNYVTYQFTRIVVGIQVLFCGISLRKRIYGGRSSRSDPAVRDHDDGLVRYSAPYVGFDPNLTFLESLCIAAAVTPTDPVLANSITTGRYAEKHVPPTFATSSSLNLVQTMVSDSRSSTSQSTFLLVMAKTKAAVSGRRLAVGSMPSSSIKFLLSIAFGGLVGYLARKTLKWAESRSYIDKANFFAYGLGLAFFTLGTTGLFGSDDILACFIAGNSFTWDDWFRIRTEDNDFQEIIDTVLNMTVFVYIGAIIPWSAYSDQSCSCRDGESSCWPSGLAASSPALGHCRYQSHSCAARLQRVDLRWLVWPIGVGAVFYIQVALRELPDDGTRDRVRAIYAPLVLFMVFSSVLTTVSPFHLEARTWCHASHGHAH